MKNVKVLMTGVTSFTGCYIAKALVRAGCEVTGVLTRPKNQYSDSLVQRRLAFSEVKSFWETAPFGSELFLEKLSKSAFDAFVSHGAAIQGYRSPDFDFVKSVSDSLKSVKEVFALLKSSGVKGILHSGTVFEPIDGLPAQSPYGLSKQMVWDAFSYYSQLSKIAITKLWIPNPIGSLENEDRLIPIFAKQWQQKTPAKLTVPRLLYDHIPADWLAQFYVRALGDLASASEPIQKHVRPSGFVLSNQELVERFRKSFQSITKLPCEYSVSEDPHFKLGVTRRNLDSCPELGDTAIVEAFWKGYADYWRPAD